MREPHWRWHDWQRLDADTLYGFLKLRSDIFVVEQNCVFSDMDGLDSQCLHLGGHGDDGELLAYLRLVPPNLKRPHTPSEAAPGPALGRIVVAASARGRGLGLAVVQQGLQRSASLWPGLDQFLSAQQHLERFYGSLGFQRIREPYLEDGIPHVDMRRPAILPRPTAQAD